MTTRHQRLIAALPALFLLLAAAPALANKSAKTAAAAKTARTKQRKASAKVKTSRALRSLKAPRKARARHWRSMTAALDPKKPIILISDHDDTLVPSWKLTKAPAAIMSPRMKSLLTRAARRGDTTVVISSGSPLHKLETFYEGVDADLIGNFGMQSRIAGKQVEDPIASAARPAVARVADNAEQLALKMGMSPDVVRRKGTSLSFHQGQLTGATWAAYSTELMDVIGEEPSLEAHVKGESVEVVPVGAGSKRASLESWLGGRYGKNWRGKVNLVYVGDSGGKGGGDEPAFKFVTEHGGIGVLVRHGSQHDPDTAAAHYARDMADVESMVSWVANRRGPRKDKGK